MGFSTSLLIPISFTFFSLSIAQGGAGCGVTCDTYSNLLASTYNLEPPTDGQISERDVEYMCGNGVTIECYQCGGFDGTESADQTLVNWAGVCQTYIEAGEGQAGYAAGVNCWDSGFAATACAPLSDIAGGGGSLPSLSSVAPAAAASSTPVTTSQAPFSSGPGSTTPAAAATTTAAETTTDGFTPASATAASSQSSTAESGSDGHAHEFAGAFCSLLLLSAIVVVF